MRKSNVSVYLMVVAVADLLALYTGLLRHVILAATGTDVREYSEAACKTHTTVVYFALDLSAWLLAALSVERCASVRWPHRVKHHCSRRTSGGVITGLALFLFAVNAHFFFLVGDVTVTLDDQTRLIRCVPLTEEGYNFVAIVWPWLDLSLFALLPLTVHVVCNSIIVRSVLTSLRKARRTRGSRVAVQAEEKGTVRQPGKTPGERRTASVDVTAQRHRPRCVNDVSSSLHPVKISKNVPTMSNKSEDLNETEQSVSTVSDTFLSAGFVLDASESHDAAAIHEVSRDLPQCFAVSLSGCENDEDGRENAVCDRKTSPASRTRHQSQVTPTSNDGNNEAVHTGDTNSNCNEDNCSHESDSAQGSSHSAIPAADGSPVTDSVADARLPSAKQTCQIKPVETTLASESSGRVMSTDTTKLVTTAHDKKMFPSSTTMTQDRRPTNTTEPKALVEESSVTIKNRANSNSDKKNDPELILSVPSGDDIAPSASKEHCSLTLSSQVSVPNPPQQHTAPRGRSIQEWKRNQPSGSRKASPQTSRNQESGSRSSSVIWTDGESGSRSQSAPRLSFESGGRRPTSASWSTRRSRTRGSGQQSEEERVSSMTWMLVTVSTVFCLTTFPLSLYTLINWILVDNGYNHPHTQVTWALLNILMYTNNAINFLLYSLSGSRFRQEMRTMWRSCCRHCCRSLAAPVPNRRRWHQPLTLTSSSISSSYSMTSSATVTSGESVLGRRWSASTHMTSSASRE
ncbi:uncharacterized protein LOC143285800 isoform X2 [Babylonia areolata]